MKVLEPAHQDILMNAIRNIPDFPKPGIQFKDITTLLNHPEAYALLISHLRERYWDYNLDFIAGIESRGFIFGAALAAQMGIGFVPVRKKGKLPSTTISEKYSLEYGFDEVEIHLDAFGEKKGAKVLLIDDLIATGGTAEASVKLIQKAGAECVEACFVLELEFLRGKEKLTPLTSVYSVLTVD